MTSSWDKALLERPEAVQRGATENINWFEDKAGEFGAYIVPNITGDRFLSRKAANCFIDFFFELDRSESISNLLIKYEKMCIDNVLDGGEVGLSPYPLLLGRAVDRAVICSHINDSLGIPVANGIIHRLCTGRSTAEDRKALELCDMSPHAAWVTWDEDTRGASPPFSFSPRQCATHIRGCLGLKLGLPTSSQPLILFEYESTHTPSLVRPTVADAGLGLRFEYRKAPPPPERDWYGLTRPHEESLVPDDKGAKPKYIRRPEALHDTIRFPSTVTGTLCTDRSGGE